MSDSNEVAMEPQVGFFRWHWNNFKARVHHYWVHVKWWFISITIAFALGHLSAILLLRGGAARW